MLKVWRASSTLIVALVIASVGQIAFFLLTNVPRSAWFDVTGTASWFLWGLAASMATVLWLVIDARPTALKALGVIGAVFMVQVATVSIWASNDHQSAGMGWIALGPAVSGAVCAAIAYVVGAAFCSEIDRHQAG